MPILKSKKGSGLAFMSVLILVLMLFLIYKANAQGIDFVTYMGDEQAYLMEAMPLTEQAKTYMAVAARQAVYDELMRLNTTSADECNLNCNQISEENVANIVDSYSNIYFPSPTVDVELPDYNVKVECPVDGVIVKAYGWEAVCEDVTLSPQKECSELEVKLSKDFIPSTFGEVDKEKCANIKAYDIVNDKLTDKPGCIPDVNDGVCAISYDAAAFFETCDVKANPFCALSSEDMKIIGEECIKQKDYISCITNPSTQRDSKNLILSGPLERTIMTGKIPMCAWYGCHDATLEPAETCANLNETRCGNIVGCEWFERYPEHISVISEPSFNYQFRILADAHFEEKVSCESFEKIFTSLTPHYNLLPTCTVKVNPVVGNTETEFTFTATYSDPEGDEMQSIKLHSTDGSSYDLDENLQYKSKFTYATKFYVNCTDDQHPNEFSKSEYQEIIIEG